MATKTDWLKGFSKEKGKVTARPTAKPGRQWLTIIESVQGLDEKGRGYVKVTFQEDNESTITQTFFQESMEATLSKETLYKTDEKGNQVPIRIDKDYNNMLAQIGEAVEPDEPFKVGRKYYANVNYGVTSTGSTKPYTNIQSYIPTEESEDMDF